MAPAIICSFWPLAFELSGRLLTCFLHPARLSRSLCLTRCHAAFWRLTPSVCTPLPTLGDELVELPILALPLLNTSLHAAFKQPSPTPYAFPLLRAPAPAGAIQVRGLPTRNRS